MTITGWKNKSVIEEHPQTSFVPAKPVSTQNKSYKYNKNRARRTDTTHPTHPATPHPSRAFLREPVPFPPALRLAKLAALPTFEWFECECESCERCACAVACTCETCACTCDPAAATGIIDGASSCVMRRCGGIWCEGRESNAL